MRKSIKKSLLLVMSLVFVFTFTLPVYAADTTSGSILLDDEAGLLTDSEASQLLETLETKSDESNCNLVVLTSDDGMTDAEIYQYEDYYYTNNIEDQTQSNFCIILLVDIYSRTVDVGTYNPGSRRNLNDDAKTELREYVTDDLSYGDYYEAFDKFAEKGSYMASRIDENGDSIKPPFPWLIRTLISLVIGFVIALIISLLIKNQLKSVNMKTNASDYIRPNSMNITKSRDRFLYSNVTKTAKPKNNSSGGGGYGGGSSGSHSTGRF